MIHVISPDRVVGRWVTRANVQERTREIARLAGRVAPHVLQADYEQAKRELTGTAETERQDAILDAGEVRGGLANRRGHSPH